MDHLSRQQLILLAILISFVTSMATGIVTVSLMDQTPRSVTQTINRVVEKTIETVVPERTNNAAAVVTKETVVVKSDDLVVESVEKNLKSLVKIYKIGQDLSNGKPIFSSIGIMTDEGIMAERFIIEKEKDQFGVIIPETYEAILPDGTKVALLPIAEKGGDKLVFFEKKGDDGKPAGINFGLPKISFGQADKLKLGQSVVQIGGSENNSVATGIVALLKKGDKDKVLEIVTDIRKSDRILGTILTNLSGEVVGFLTADMPDGSFLPAEILIDWIIKKEPFKQ